MDKSDKYYDVKNYRPKAIYPKDDGTTTYLKAIRLPKEELDNWDSKAIHEFLQGNTKSNDALKINLLKKDLKRLYQIMNVFLLPKITESKIAEIPNSVIEEIETLEEGYNFE